MLAAFCVGGYWSYMFLCKDVGYVDLSWSDQSDCVEGMSTTKPGQGSFFSKLNQARK